MPKILRWLAQALFYGAFAAFVGYFSTSPAYQHLPEGSALLRLSFSHPAKLKTDCRKRSAEELAKFPANMRVEQDCPRERSSVHVRIELDGRTLVDETFPPTGLHNDGAASAYRRIPVDAGPHTLVARFNDDARVSGFNFTRTESIDMKPGQIVLIDFTGDRGGIIIR